MPIVSLDNIQENKSSPHQKKGHYERVNDLPGQLWYPEKEGDSIEGIFMELRDSNKYDSLIVLKEHKDKLRAEGRDENEETIVPGWAVLHKRFLNMEIGTQVRITYQGEKPTKDGRGTAKQFIVEKWVWDETQEQ